jgi:hypothetical protein
MKCQHALFEEDTNENFEKKGIGQYVCLAWQYLLEDQ